MQHDEYDDIQRNTGDAGGEGGLTTEDLVHPGAEEDKSAVYPGEATAEDTTAEDTTADDTTAEGTTADATTGDETTAGETAADDTAAGETAAGGHEAGEEEAESLIARDEAEEFRRTWGEIQGRFVDDPQDAVRSADRLVAEVMQTLARTFSARKQELEGQWDRGEHVATEDLRLALQQYRSFFNRLLST